MRVFVFFLWRVFRVSWVGIFTVLFGFMRTQGVDFDRFGVWGHGLGSSARATGSGSCRFTGSGPTRRLHSSSFLGLPYRILNTSHKKGTTMEPMGMF